MCLRSLCSTLASVSVLVIATAGSAFALQPDTIRGRVLDTSGNPIGGAEIVLADLGRVAISRPDGRFSIAILLPATLVIRHAGYAPETRVVRRVEPLQVSLTTTPFSVDPINVTATRAPTTGTASLAQGVLGREELRREAGVSLAHELDRVPGVRTVSTGEQIGKPVIRGVFGSRVLVLEDAQRLEDYSWSDEDAPSIDARFADRVEVVRGPASILYGSDAVGGVVNVIPSPVPQPGAGFHRGTLEVTGSSNRREAGVAGSVEGASHALGWRALLVGHFADDFRTPDGPVDNTGYGALNGELAAGTQKPWGALTLRYARYAGEFKLLEMDAPQTPQPGMQDAGPERKLSDDRIQFVGVFPARSVRFETRAQLQRHWLQEVGDLAGSTGQKIEAPVFELLLNTFTADVLAHHSLASNMQGTVGVSLLSQANDSRGPLLIVPDANIGNVAVSAVEHLTTGRVDWIAGARADHHSVSPDAAALQHSSRSAVSFNAGSVARLLPSVSIRGNVGRAWRAPNLFELYADGPRIGEARYEIGDPSLQPERSTELDVGADVSSRSVRAQVTWYQNRIEDFITLKPTALFRDGLRVYRHEQLPAKLTGWEGEAEVRATAALHLFAAYDAVQGEARETGAPLPWIPAPRLQAHLEWAGSAAGLRHAYVRIGGEHVAKKTRTAANEPATGGYALMNLGIGAETRWIGRTVRIDGAVKNALNRRYTDFLNRYRDFALNPGRDITVRLSIDF